MLTFSLRQFAVQMLAVKRLTEDAPSLDWLIKFFEPTPMWQPATIRIWPDPRKEIVWPPRATMPREAMQALADRYGSEFDLCLTNSFPSLVGTLSLFCSSMILLPRKQSDTDSAEKL